MASKRRALRSPKHRRRRRRRRNIILGVGFSLALAALVGVWYLARLPAITIANVRFTGETVIAHEELQKAVEPLLEGTYVFLLPRRNIFVHPKGKTTAVLKEAFPRLDEVTIRRVGFDELVIALRERAARALWCEEESSRVRSRCYFVDGDGSLFAEAPHFSGAVFVTYFGGAVEGSRVGGRVLPEAEFRELSRFVDASRSAGLSPESIVIDEHDYTLVLGSGTRLLVSRSQPLTETLANVEALLESGSLSVDEIEDIEYVDLRFGNRVFFRNRADNDTAM